MIDLDKMEKDAKKKVTAHINKVAKKVEKANAESFAEARINLLGIDQMQAKNTETILGAK